MTRDSAVLELLSQVDTPALLLDIEAVTHNITTMADFFEPLPAFLRPHFKTHKCTKIARLQMQAGAIGMTCAKVGEAEFLLGCGIRDILIANEVAGTAKIARLMNLAERAAELKVAVDHVRHVRELSRATTARGIELGVLVEVDVGMGRCGLSPGEELVELCRLVDDSPSLIFNGLMGYEGHAVCEEDPVRREALATEAMKQLTAARELVEQSGLEVEVVSAGGTGTYDVTGRFPGVTEVQAGSYVLMDATYRKVRREFRPALSVLSTIISCPRKGVAVADAGSKSLSGEFGPPEVTAPEGVKVKRLCEEHAILEVAPSVQLSVGGRIALLPSHCCTTVNLHDEFVVIEHGRERERWAIEARGKSQ